MSTATRYPSGVGAAEDLGPWHAQKLTFTNPIRTWVESSFRIEPLTEYGRINSITWGMVAWQTHTGDYCVRPTIITNGQYAFGTDTHIIVEDQEYSLSYTWYSNPITGMAWTFQDICDLQIGVRVYKEYAAASAFFGYQPYLIVDYTPVGATQFSILRPNGPGDASECSRSAGNYNYECVDEETPNDDTDYVRMGSSSSAEYKDLYALSDIAYVPNIQYVAEYIRVYSKDTKGPWNYYTLIKTHGSEYRGPHECQFPGVWRYLNTVWTKNPYTGNNWTVDEVNSLQAGLILSGLATVDRARCSQVYVSTLGVRFSGRPRVQIVGPIF